MPVGFYDGDSGYIKGGTDATLIGNTSDALKVTGVVSSGYANIVSSGNSTTSSLSANATYTGTGEDTLLYGTIIVSVYSSHVGSFTVQWSSDNVNWRADGDVYAVTAGTIKGTTYGPKARYFRIVYTNGGTTTTTFFVQTIYKVGHTKPSSHMISEGINDSADAELVKAVLTGRRSDGTYANVDISNNTDLGVGDICNFGGSSGALTVGTSAVIAAVSGANLANRKCLTVYNNGSATIYWGLSNAVTTSTGTPIGPLRQATFAFGPNTSVYLISGTAGQNARITETA